ncbi:thiamine diphosphokinase [Miniphocaeibacter halophilus]|uniref:Thiamine diphosphokinase n=1 Tax=Miniphocaeibacter halophilus TaxID=2931922 RepID=A0AC61MQ35_9FIRM|nr:thiamine diphosphokinase [Miniphocaeibacter halophilus]QQK07752.1 thiamine diphosphokinase [Miniphocaeibacter halophilus]
MIGLIVSGGNKVNDDILKKYSKKADFIIAVDKGAESLIENNIKIDLLVGDFDSINKKYLNILEEKKTSIIKLEIEKDDSDTEAALNYLIKKKFSKIFMLNCTGSRLDHTFSNVLLLKKLLDNNIKGYLIDNNNRITITNSKVKIEKEYDNISIIPLTLEGINVTLEGFYYKLFNENIEYGSSRCLSNFLIKDFGNIFINSGLAIIIESND